MNVSCVRNLGNHDAVSSFLAIHLDTPGLPGFDAAARPGLSTRMLFCQHFHANFLGIPRCFSNTESTATEIMLHSIIYLISPTV